MDRSGIVNGTSIHTEIRWPRSPSGARPALSENGRILAPPELWRLVRRFGVAARGLAGLGFAFAKFWDLRRRRRLRADLGLVVRGRVRPPDPRPRAGPLRRGPAARLRSRRPGLHPFLGAYVTIRNPRMNPWRELLDLAGRPALGERGRGGGLGDRRAAGLPAPPGARLRRLPPQPLQPGPDRVPRRRLDLALDQDAAAGRNPREGERRARRLRRPGRAARARDVRRARPPAPPLMPGDSRSTAGSSSTRDAREAHVELIADEFLRGFEAVDRIPRPAVTVFGSARGRATATPTTSGARAAGGCCAEAGFAVVTGGGPGVMEAANRGCQGGRRPLGRLQHRASARAGAEPVHRPRDRLPPLLRAQGDAREGGGGLHPLPRRLRHARRAVRVADADPDRQGARVPRLADRRRLLARAARLDRRTAALEDGNDLARPTSTCSTSPTTSPRRSSCVVCTLRRTRRGRVGLIDAAVAAIREANVARAPARP